MGGCESGFTVPDPTDPNIVWATCYGDEVTRWDARIEDARSVSPWLHTLDSPPQGDQVSVPLDPAAGHRSFRSQHRLLRLPGDFQNHERRAELVGDQSRIFPHRIQRGSFLQAELLATISDNFMAK